MLLLLSLNPVSSLTNRMFKSNFKLYTPIVIPLIILHSSLAKTTCTLWGHSRRRCSTTQRSRSSTAPRFHVNLIAYHVIQMAEYPKIKSFHLCKCCFQSSPDLYRTRLGHSMLDKHPSVLRERTYSPVYCIVYVSLWPLLIFWSKVSVRLGRWMHFNSRHNGAHSCPLVRLYLWFI